MHKDSKYNSVKCLTSRIDDVIRHHLMPRGSKCFEVTARQCLKLQLSCVSTSCNFILHTFQLDLSQQ